jgi:hypothetical protein
VWQISTGISRDPRKGNALSAAGWRAFCWFIWTFDKLVEPRQHGSLTVHGQVTESGHYWNRLERG